MKPTISASKSTHAEIDAAVAEHVASLRIRKEWHGIQCDPGNISLPPYSTRTDAVIPLLDKENFWTKTGYSNFITIGYFSPESSDPCEATASDNDFPRAACFALLRAHGIEVTD